MEKLIYFELRKLFSRRLTQTALFGILLLSVFLNVSSYQNKYAFDGKSKEGTGNAAVEIDKEIAAKYEGILTDDKIKQIMSDFAPKTNLHGLNAVYLYYNALQSATFRRFADINGNWNGLRVSDVFGNEEIKIGYIDGWLTTSQNMAKILVVLSFVIITMIAPVFCGEYEGVDNIILTSKYGKTKCTAAKATASVLTAIIAAALTVAVNLTIAFAFYGKSGLDCSILFTSADFAEGFIPFNITCSTLLRYQILMAFTGAVSVTGITLLISAVSQKQIAAFIASATIYIFPIMLPITESNPLFRFIGLLPLYHAQCFSLMSIEQMHNGILYAVWAVPTAILILGVGIFVSRKIFARHQIF